MRKITADDLYRFQLISDCQMSPDGRHTAFCVERVDEETQKKYSSLWVAATGGGDVLRITYGDQTDDHPRWSPDGSQIAFLSNRLDEEQKQIYLLPFGGGESQPLTNLRGEFKMIEWSPDGQYLVFQFRKKDQEVIDLENNKRKKELGIVARHITRIFFKEDGTGYLPEQRWHLWTLNVESGKARQLTDHDLYDEVSPAWSPDGKHIAFFSNRAPDPDLDPDVIDLFVIPADGGEPIRLETPIGQKSLLSYSPNGRWLAYIGSEGRGKWWLNDSVWIVPADGKSGAINLTGHLDIQVGNGTIGDIVDRPTVVPRWSPDGEKVYFQLTQHGQTTLHSISLKKKELEAVVTSPGVIGAYSLDESGSKIACCYSNFSDPGNVWLFDARHHEFRQLTDFNREIVNLAELHEPEEVWFKGRDSNVLQGWILKPPGFDAEKRYPSILEIHGGPWLQYGHTFMHEFYFLAAQGYVVYFCNPRGSQGYGEEHSSGINFEWGRVDYEDVMAWADFMEQQLYIDADRMGVTGGSYGGYMTTWIIGHTDRFKAAVAQRVVSNFVSFVGTSDFNWQFQQVWAEGVAPWDDLMAYWRQSPMATIGNATTPTLIIHSEQDDRCDLEQGVQVYIALKRLGVETELLLFPGESHGLSRGGRTDRRVARLEHIVRWFDRYLKS